MAAADVFGGREGAFRMVAHRGFDRHHVSHSKA
jgi:hypothetical protein